MDVSKIIRGIVNSRGYTITSAITQWDYGYVFVPEFDDLPATYRLDFSNDEHHGTALPVYCGSEGGEVPEELIDTGKDIFVWFFISVTDSARVNTSGKSRTSASLRPNRMNRHLLSRAVLIKQYLLLMKQ